MPRSVLETATSSPSATPGSEGYEYEEMALILVPSSTVPGVVPTLDVLVEMGMGSWSTLLSTRSTRPSSPGSQGTASSATTPRG